MAQCLAQDDGEAKVAGRDGPPHAEPSRFRAPDCRAIVELLKTRPMRQTRDHRHSLDRAAHCGAGPFARTTMEFAAVPDHVRLPGRFFGRFTTAASSVL